MTDDQFTIYLKERYQSQLTYFDGRAIISKRRYVMFQSGAIIFAVAAPILVVALPEVLKFITASVSALAAFFTTTLKTFRFHDTWMSSRATHDALVRERYYHLAGLDVYRNATDACALFVERVETLLARENGDWLMSEKPAVEQGAKGSQQPVPVKPVGHGSEGRGGNGGPPHPAATPEHYAQSAS